MHVTQGESQVDTSSAVGETSSLQAARELECMFRSQANKYKRRALIDLFLTVAVLVASLILFTLGEDIQKKLFPSLWDEIVTDVVEDVQKRKPEIYAKLDEYIDTFLLEKTEENQELVAPPQPQLEETTSGENADDLDSWLDSHISYHREIDSRFNTLLDNHETVIAISNALKEMSVEKQASTLNLELERHRISNDTLVKKYLADIDYEKTEYLANSEEEIEELRADALVDVAEKEAEEGADRASAYADSMTTIATRISALILGMWMVKIFNANRRMSEARASHSEKLANLFSIASYDPAITTSELLPYIFRENDKVNDDVSSETIELIKNAMNPNGIA